MKLPVWNPSPFAILQALHLFIAATIVLGLVVFLGISALAACYLAVVFAILKDLVWDWLTETTTFAEEAMDLTFYVLGAVVVTGVLWVRGIGR